jgi:hypothetical protein
MTNYSNDDWRVQIDVHEDRVAHDLYEALEEGALEHKLERAFHDRVVVSRDGDTVYCYAGDRAQAEAVEGLVRSLSEEHGWGVETQIRRWHPIEESWEDPDAPLPAGEQERRDERAELIERERSEAEESGYPEFEVRVEFATHHDAMDMVERLRSEGLSSVHRWKYLLVGALDEDSANALAERLRDEAPPGSTVKVEGSWRAVQAEVAPSPFAFLGGLGT